MRTLLGLPWQLCADSGLCRYLQTSAAGGPIAILERWFQMLQLQHEALTFAACAKAYDGQIHSSGHYWSFQAKDQLRSSVQSSLACGETLNVSSSRLAFSA